MFICEYLNLTVIRCECLGLTLDWLGSLKNQIFKETRGLRAQFPVYHINDCSDWLD